MNFWRANIQCRPTPRNYEKRGKVDILVHMYAAEAVSIITSLLHNIVVSVGTFSMGNAIESVSVTTSLLYTVIKNIGTYAMGNAVESISVTTSLLYTLVKNVGTYAMGNTVENVSIETSTLLTVVINVGTFPTTGQKNLIQDVSVTTSALT